jgi:hypothetical protein
MCLETDTLKEGTRYELGFGQHRDRYSFDHSYSAHASVGIRSNVIARAVKTLQGAARLCADQPCAEILTPEAA